MLPAETTDEILCGKPANLDAFIPTESETGDYNGPVFIDPSVSFTTLCDLIDNTPDIKKYIGEGVTGHTIFAPTDAAFAEISGYIPGLDALEMQHLLQLHILGDTYLTTSLTCGKMYGTLNLDLSTQQRSQTTCGGVASSAFQIGGGNVDDNFPEIGNPIDVFNAFEFYAFSDTFALRMKLFGHRFSADVVGCNGVIHVVDNVLLPGDDFSTKDEMLYRDIP